MGNLNKRISEIKMKRKIKNALEEQNIAPEKLRSDEENSGQPTKKSRSSSHGKLKALGLSALLFISSQIARAQSSDHVQDREQDLTESRADTSANTIKITPAAPKNGIRAAAANLAMDVDFMSNFLMEEGENALENFEVAGVEWSRAMAQGIEAGEFNRMVSSCTNAGIPFNRDGHHCYAGVKAILRKAGINLEGAHAYEAAAQLRAHPDFVELKCDYSVLPCLPEGTIVVQDHGRGRQAPDGHIFVTKKENGTMVQKCGKTYNLPQDDFRSRRTGEHYGQLSVFLHKSCTLGLETLANLYERGCFKNSAEDMLIPVLQENSGLINDMMKPNNNPANQSGGVNVAPSSSQNESGAAAVENQQTAQNDARANTVAFYNHFKQNYNG
ncbi:MAG: hypothetical protein IJ689_03225 [Alphaproteobacteria bacterium]|nr:hypothetical protein [Alphaproteobacteria bacterium]